MSELVERLMQVGDVAALAVEAAERIAALEQENGQLRGRLFEKGTAYGVEPDIARRTYQIDEAARLLGIGRNQAYEAARKGEIPTIKIGKRLLVPKEPLDQMLAGAKP